MCVNAETSLLSLIIGEMSGLLMYMNNDIDKNMFGLFVMFYTLVQYFEFNMYKYKNIDLNSRLLLVNLGSQGFIFFILMSKLYDVNVMYLIISGFIMIYIISQSLDNNFKKANMYACKNIIKDKCNKWEFLTDKTSSLLGLMYGIMFMWYFTDKRNKFINKTGQYFALTAIVSYLFLKSKNSPSYWCMSSAVLAPIFLIE
jgi:hypothetical protein